MGELDEWGMESARRANLKERDERRLVERRAAFMEKNKQA